MASDKAPAFQFYPRDFLTDEHVVLMDLEERGAYITLLCMCWLEGSLPATDEDIAHILRIHLNKWSRLSKKVKARFTPNEAGRLVNPRMEEERAKQLRWLEKSVEGGLRSAASRRAKKLKGGSTTLQPPFEPNVNTASASADVHTVGANEPRFISASDVAHGGNVIVAPELEGRAADLLNWWRDEYPRRQSGAPYPTLIGSREVIEYDAAKRLVANYPDDKHLRNMAVYFLCLKGDKFVDGRTRTLRMFESRAAGIDAELRAHGFRPES